MTSATQSNSGCSAYIGFLLRALLGNPDVITSENLQTRAWRSRSPSCSPAWIDPPQEALTG